MTTAEDRLDQEQARLGGRVVETALAWRRQMDRVHRANLAGEDLGCFEESARVWKAFVDALDDLRRSLGEEVE